MTESGSTALEQTVICLRANITDATALIAEILGETWLLLFVNSHTQLEFYPIQGSIS